MFLSLRLLTSSAKVFLEREKRKIIIFGSMKEKNMWIEEGREQYCHIGSIYSQGSSVANMDHFTAGLAVLLVAFSFFQSASCSERVRLAGK